MLLKLGVITLAAVAFAVQLPPATVESLYTRGFYASLQPWLTSLSNKAPFSMGEVAALVLLAVLLIRFGSSVLDARRRRSWRPIGSAALNLVVAGAVVYLAFLAAWGLNYRRQPLAERLAFDAAAAPPEAVTKLAWEAVRQVNATYEPGRQAGYPGWSELPVAMDHAFKTVHAHLAPGVAPVAGLPKLSLLALLFERAGVSGMINPFMLETLVDRSLLPFERPFVAGHEWAHLAGYASEAEANYVGWLTCVNGPPFAAYSGWLALYSQVLAEVPRAGRPALVRALAAGPRADLTALAERAKRIQPRVQAISWRVYDRYLKANRIEQGVANYDQSLTLLLGSRFTRGWLPEMKPATDPPRTLPLRQH